jgi:diaminopropionate ammonia-lyase
MCEYSTNPYYKENPDWSLEGYSFLKTFDMIDFHKSIEGYEPTPLVSLISLSQKLGIGNIYVKDESYRFGIKAFKALGASYAIFRTLKDKWEKEFNQELTPEILFNTDIKNKLGELTFCAATDGNHGKAVAWTANKLKQKAVIYMPSNTAKSRIDSIYAENGKVVLVDGTFDDCVKKAAEDSAKKGWQVISDTSYPGYMEIPAFILLGYTTIFKEIEEQIELQKLINPDFVFLQSGVGGLSAAGTSHYVSKYGEKRPKLISVEPVDSDCFLESIKYGKGEPIPTKGKQESIMAGLNCGIPSPLAWKIIKDGMYLFLSVTDKYAEEAMRTYYNPSDGDERIISGESGSAGLAGLLAIMKSKNLSEAKSKLGINKKSNILLINTEGDTDPENFKKIVLND